MNQELIHIGFPKTASTWLQENLFPLVRNMDVASTEEIFQWIIRPHAFHFDAEKVRNYFLTRYKKPLIISQENLLGFMNLGGHNGVMTKELGQRLHDVFPEARIIIFTRNQTDLIASAYFNYVQNGGTYGINKFLFHQANKSLLFSFHYLEFDKLITYYHSLFGEENVHVFPYEKLQSNPQKFIRSFIETFDLEILQEAIDFSPKNKRYRAGLLRMVRLLNIFTHERTLYKYYCISIPGWYSTTRRLYKRMNAWKVFGRYPSSAHILGVKNVEYIRNFYRESNASLQRLLPSEKLAELGYPM